MTHPGGVREVFMCMCYSKPSLFPLIIYLCILLLIIEINIIGHNGCGVTFSLAAGEVTSEVHYRDVCLLQEAECAFAKVSR